MSWWKRLRVKRAVTALYNDPVKRLLSGAQIPLAVRGVSWTMASPERSRYLDDMTDQADRLTAALADRYAIEREIGAGGMATVYLASDLRHERHVAIKTLRPEIAATLGRERFIREIKLAAQLQHPNILPLLDSGEADDVLYYVMPHVPGESLREKLHRGGELPIGEAVRILCDVVDALDHAHHQGVVHRDIKPDNVMVSGRHALVMDFGVAKAVSDATDKGQLTTAGMAVGTPSYMAPEQAVTGGLIDQRADIYALGIMAYEMLTGRPPFVGATPQEIVAAHVTKIPEPVTKYRDRVPAVLAQIVARCLEKSPADRWQTAEELLSQLESVNESVGHPPDRLSTVQADVGRDVLGRMKQFGSGRLVRATALYVLLAVVVLVAVRVTTVLFGLPRWFGLIGIVLVAMGLAIFLTTSALVDTQRPGGPSDTSLTRNGPHRWLNWQRALLAGLVVMAGLGSVGAGVVWLRNLGHELYNDVVAVMPFHVLGADVGLWREGLVDVMRTALDGTGQYRASDPRAVLNEWRRSLGDAVDLPTPNKAAEVSRSLSAGRFILGSVIRTAPGTLRVTADLYSTRWLRREGSAAVEGSDADMVSLVDRLTVELLRSVWRGSGQPENRISTITTSSPAALRAYLEGEQAFRRSQFESARQSLSRAVEADSTFAMAFHRLAQTYWSSNIAAPEASSYSAAAIRHSGGLPQRDSLAILGYKLMNVDGDIEAIQLFERLTTMHPDDLEAWYGLGKSYYHFGYTQRYSVTRAIGPLERALALDSSFAPALIHLVELAHFVGDSSRAVDWTSRYLTLDSTSRFATAFRVGAGLRFGSPKDSVVALGILDTIDARTLPLLCDCGIHDESWPLQFTVGGTWSLPLFEVIARAGVNPRFRDDARGATLLALGRHHLRFGRIGRGFAHTVQGHGLDSTDWRAIYSMASAGFLGLVADSDSGVVRAWLDQAGISSAWQWPQNQRWRLPLQQWQLGVAAVHIDLMSDAQRAMNRLSSIADSMIEAGDSVTGQFARSASWSLRGLIAAAYDSIDTAIAHLERGLATRNPFMRWGRDLDSYFLATLLESRGAAESQAEALGIYGTLTTPWLEALGFRRRAVLHERRGEVVAAQEYYGKFVALWENADPHLQPLVDEARRAIERLTER